MRQRQFNFRKVLFELEITEDRFLNLMNSPSPQLATERLEDLKRVARKQRRILAVRFHPDKPNGSLEKMQRINLLVDMLLKLQIRVEVPSYEIHVMSNVYTGNTNTSSTISF